jgi:sigma-B regulation protein RsbU (phosphoserine phosphatase)
MFVAATYALINAKERLMSLSNAGQPEPLLLRAAAEPAFVETAGDRFPLGIVGAAAYEETRIALEPGDTVIFYSDGVVEAMNGAEELYGFERLIGAVRGGGGRTAGQLLGMILDDVNSFAGQQEQHDDLTVVVVRVV